MRVLSIFALMFLSKLVFAQEFINGKIIDDKLEAVPYATVIIKRNGRGTIADVSGNFSINKISLLDNDTLKISSMGFKEVDFLVKEKTSDSDTIIIFLKTRLYELAPVTINPVNPKQELEIAVKHFNKNCNPVPYTYETFFRQFHRENGRAVRLIEASVDVYDPGYYFTQSKELRERTKINAIRRSKVYEKNGDEHGEHLGDLLNKNIINYPFSTVLNPRTMNYYKLKYEHLNDSLKPYDLAIHYYYKIDSDPKIESGTIYLDKENHKIHRIEQKTYPNSNYTENPMISGDNSNWKFMEESFTLTYKYIKGKMYIDHFDFYYKHRIYNPTFRSFDYLVEEYFDLWTGEVNIKPDVPTQEYKQGHNLYTKKYDYNPDYWKDFYLYKRHPLEPKIIEEFNKHENLEMQFEGKE